jgi:hypothetical protein
LTLDRLDALAPIKLAAMQDRQVIAPRPTSAGFEAAGTKASIWSAQKIIFTLAIKITNM